MIDGYGSRCFNVTRPKFPKRYEIFGYAESIPYITCWDPSTCRSMAEIAGYTPGMETLYEPSS